LDYVIKSALICCSHRPLDLDNVYNQDQIKILIKEGETLEIPDFDDIYASSDVRIINQGVSVLIQTTKFYRLQYPLYSIRDCFSWALDNFLLTVVKHFYFLGWRRRFRWRGDTFEKKKNGWFGNIWFEILLNIYCTIQK
jgi:hypothetical protein